jgi:olfactory receptor
MYTSAMRRELNRNYSEVTEFILLGFRTSPKLQILLFLVFLIIYTVIVLGNISLITVIKVDSRLETPMYFFLRNLSYLDLCYSTVIAPNMLANFLSTEKKISYNCCAVQFFLFALFVTTEGFLLSVMAFDQLSAICSPLLYPVQMSHKVGVQLVAGAYVGGCINSIVQTCFTFKLCFCGENRLDHFFCDVPALLKISCVDTFVNEFVLFILSAFIIITTNTVILVFYVCVLCCLKDLFYSRQDKDFLYLWFPYIGGEFILWNFVLHVCPTWGHLLTRAKQDCSCVLHSYDTNAEPSNIQSEKQRC